MFYRRYTYSTPPTTNTASGPDDNILSTLIEDVCLLEYCQLRKTIEKHLVERIFSCDSHIGYYFVLATRHNQRTAENMFGIFIGMRQDAKE